jgi:hypothetical protein
MEFVGYSGSAVGTIAENNTITPNLQHDHDILCFLMETTYLSGNLSPLQ